MNDIKTELEKRDIQRLSNEEANRLTRECIQEALIRLMAEKPFDRISVTEIVRRSGVSRTAFYRNFSSKEEVISDISYRILDSITELVCTAARLDQPHQVYCRLFQMIRDNSTNFDLLLKADFPQKRSETPRNYIANRFADLSREDQYTIFGWYGAVENLIIDWYLHGMEESVSYMADLCCRLFPNLNIRQ